MPPISQAEARGKNPLLKAGSHFLPSNENSLRPYRKLLLGLSSELSTSVLEKLKFASIDLIPRGTIENATSGLKFFDVLEQDVRIIPQNLSLLENMLTAIGRMDLASKIQQFMNDDSNRIVVGGNTNDAVPDGGVGDSNSAGNDINPSNKDEADKEEFDDVVRDDGDDSDRDYKTVPAMKSSSQGLGRPAHVAAYSQVQAEQYSRLQRDSSVGAAPVRYVNYLAYENYSVEIIGGKHFKTPDGEFVEIKSGTQYKIHVKNSRAYDCNLDVSIDGYDVGGWVVNGGEELTIERPAYEPKLFTFYRVKTAPKEAGIESGRPENGVVKCVFTPEAFVDIPVFISGLPEPLKVAMAPSAAVGDLKLKVQSQRNTSEDPDQILALNGKVQSNSTSLRSVLKSSGNLRLIDTELEVTVEASSNEIFPVKIRPGNAKVIDVMEQIERKLEVPIKDQKLYHGKSRLSKAPQRGLPAELICSLQPTVVVIVPEYILITVEDSVSGNTNIVKIDKERSLTDLMEEMPSCRNLQENQQAIFYVNGKALYPPKDEGTLTSLGISSGSKIEVKVEITFIEIRVAGLPGLLPRQEVWFRCCPHETFRDLLNKVEARSNTIKLEGATFTTQQRVFDPEEDTCSLKDYDIEHRSTLMLEVAEPQDTNDDSAISQEAEASHPENRNLLRIERKMFDTASTYDQDYCYPEDEIVPAGNYCYPEDEIAFSRGAEQPMGSSPFSCGAEQPVGSSLMDLADEGLYDDVQQTTGRVLTENDPAWKAGGTTLQGYSTQRFTTADPIKVDPSRKIELVLRLVAREDETDVVFPKDECKPLSTLYPPAVPE